MVVSHICQIAILLELCQPFFHQISSASSSSQAASVCAPSVGLDLSVCFDVFRRNFIAMIGGLLAKYACSLTVG